MGDYLRVRTIIKKIIFIFICLYLLIGEANATDYYVSPNGTGNGLTIETPGDPATLDSSLHPGDTMYFLPGTYIGKQIYLDRNNNFNGNLIPITLKKYNDTVILDGVDNSSGYGINTRWGHYLVIDGIEMKSYKNAIYLEYEGHNIEIKNCVIHNCSHTAFNLFCVSYGTVNNISIHDCNIYNIGPSNIQGNAAILYGSLAPNTQDISFYNLTIHDNQNPDGTSTTIGALGIDWSTTKRLHIYNVSITNISSNCAGIALRQNVTDSVIEDFYINNTGWHAIGLNNGGGNYLRNITIRNGYVGYPGHNGIDVHTGNRDQYIYNVTIVGINNNGINYMTDGTNLTVDNISVTGHAKSASIIQNNATFTNFTTYSVLSYPVEISGQNAYIDNCNLAGSVTSDTFFIHSSNGNTPYNFTIVNTYGENKNINLQDGYGTVKNYRDNQYKIVCDSDVYANVEYDKGRVFTSDVGVPSYTPSGSILNATSTRTITAYNYSALPESGSVEVTPQTLSGNEVANFTGNSTNGINVNFAVWNLIPNQGYAIKVDGTTTYNRTANSTGYITFPHSSWSTHTFSVEPAAAVANFAADKTEGITPLTVKFTDKSTNRPTGWKWNFGDSQTSTVQNPEHTFSGAGVYNVTLVATNDGGSSDVKSMDITVNRVPTPPVANLTEKKTEGTIPLTLQISLQIRPEQLLSLLSSLTNPPTVQPDGNGTLEIVKP